MQVVRVPDQISDIKGLDGRLRQIRPVSNRTNFPYQTSRSNGTDVVHTYRTYHPFPQGGRDLRLVFANTWLSASNVEYSQSAVAIKAAIETSAGYVPVYFNGADTAVLGAQARVVISDPIGVVMPVGGSAWVRASYTVASGDKFVLNAVGLGVDGTKDSRVVGTESAWGTGALSGNFSGVYGAAPAAILGTPLVDSAPGIIIIGDSIARGDGDNPSTGSNHTEGGYIRRALYGQLGYTINAISGSDSSAFVFPGNTLRTSLFKYHTHAICEYGINGIGASLDTQKANLLALWTLLANHGLKVFQTTITPKTTSTDSWATVANQTVTANESKRTALNDWIRTCPSPLSGVFEAADIVEVNAQGVQTRNGGFWPAGWTGDGTHPNTAANAAMAACIDLTKMRLI